MRELAISRQLGDLFFALSRVLNDNAILDPAQQ
jgi:hypothetical protein